MLVWKRILWLRERIAEQERWIERCGGSLEGYVRNYGDPGIPPVDENGDPKVVLVPKDRAHLVDGHLRLHPDEDRMPGVTHTKFFARHFGDGGTAIWNADKARFDRWREELAELEIHCFAAKQKADQTKKAREEFDPIRWNGAVVRLRNQITRSLRDAENAASQGKPFDDHWESAQELQAELLGLLQEAVDVQWKG